MVKIAETIRLNAIGEDCKQQMPRQMGRGGSLKHALPSGAQPLQIEITQVRDLVPN
jgi:hypothetical protein